MTFSELLRQTRSIRRFQQEPIERSTLEDLVDLARSSASGANQQPLKYWLSCDKDMNEKIFPCTIWAGALPDWPGPEEGERPTGYIVLLTDLEVSKTCGCDQGIAAWSVCLGAAEKGLGACMIGSIKRNELREVLGIPDRFKIELIVALGAPAEEVILEEAKAGQVTYYRDAELRHHVPKRPLQEVIIQPGS